MAKTDAEITLKVNMPPPTGPSFTDEVKRLRELYAQTNAELQKSSGIYKGMSAEARALYNEVKALGSSGLLKAFESSFSSGFGTAATMDRQAARIGQNTSKHIKRVEQVVAAVSSGKLTEEQGLRYLQQPGTGLEMGAEALSDLEHVRAVTEFDQGSQGGFKDITARAKAFNEQLRGEADGARLAAAEYRKLADARAEEREALDVADPLYAKRAQMLQQEENQLRRTSAELNKEADALDTVERKMVAQLDAYTDTDEYRKETYETIEKGLQKVAQTKEKVIAITGRQAAQDNKAAIDKQKLADAEKRQQEAAERRAVQEAKRAAQEEKIREKELYQMSLIGKKRLELAEIIKTLNAERKKAADARDIESLERLNMKLSVARSQMRAVSMQANVSRMMFTQQASAVSRMAGNVKTLTEGFSSLSDVAKIGQADFSSMASSMMDLWLAFKAGLGPVGWVMMAIQGVQVAIKKASEITRLSAKEEANRAKSLELVADSYGKIADAQKKYEQEKKRITELEDIKKQYDEIDKVVDASYKVIQDTYIAEQNRLGILNKEKEAEIEKAKIALETKLISGEINQHEYSESLALIDEQTANMRNEQMLKKASDAHLLAVKMLEEATEADKTAADALKKAKLEADKFDISPEALQTMKATEEALIKEVEDLRGKHRFAITRLKNYTEGWKKDEHGRWMSQDEDGKWRHLNNWQLIGLSQLEAEVRKYQGPLTEAKTRLNRQLFTDKARLGGLTVEEYEDARAKALTHRDAAQQRADKAEANRKARLDAVEEARKKQFQAGEDYVANAKIIKNTATGKRRILGAKKAAEDEAKARAEEIEIFLRDIQSKTFKELDKLIKSASDKQSGFVEDSPGWGAWGAAKKRIEEEKDARKRANAERRKERRRAIYREAEDEKKTKKYKSAFLQKDEKGRTPLDYILRAEDDGVISKKEAQVLIEGLKRAQKLQLGTLEDIIQAIINNNAFNEKTRKEVRAKLQKNTTNSVR